MHPYSKISTYEIRKIIECFCVDIDATKTAKVRKLNRKTVNRYFGIFRKAIFEHQVIRTKKLFGEIELDEMYVGANRLRGVPGKRGRGTNK